MAGTATEHESVSHAVGRRGCRPRMQGGSRRYTVLMLNNYSVAAIDAAWRRGVYPGHHLWGGDFLPDFGFDLCIPPFVGLPPLARRLAARAPSAWGDLDQQIRALARWRCDVVYSACQYTTGLLARLRTRGLFRRPLVALLHHELPREPASRAFVAGHTRLVCLSLRVRAQLIETFGVPAEEVKVLDWGPDLRFFAAFDEAPEHTEPLAVSVGKSFRDHDLLAVAARQAGVRCTIVGTPPTRDVAGSGVEVIPIPAAGPHLPYPDVVRLCRKARVFAIPLGETGGLAGLTSLVDALGMGKAVIMTRNAFVDIDIEREGIGRWVDRGDVAAWRQALAELVNDEALCLQMGRRARQLAERRYNSGRFSAQLAAVLTDALADPRCLGERAKRRPVSTLLDAAV